MPVRVRLTLLPLAGLPAHAQPGYHALGRLRYHLKGYDGVQRLRVADGRVRLSEQSSVPVRDGVARVTLTPVPVLLRPAR
jgi:hypothetical protein